MRVTLAHSPGVIAVEGDYHPEGPTLLALFDERETSAERLLNWLNTYKTWRNPFVLSKP